MVYLIANQETNQEKMLVFCKRLPKKGTALRRRN